MNTGFEASHLRSAAFLLKNLVEVHGPAPVVQSLKPYLKVQCLHWDIEERVVGGSVLDTPTGKILRSQPLHERECLHCHLFEAGTLAPDGKKKNRFAVLVGGPNRKIRTVNLRPKKG